MGGCVFAGGFVNIYWKIMYDLELLRVVALSMCGGPSVLPEEVSS